MKKLLALLLVLAMIFNMTIIAAAAETETVDSDVATVSNLPQLGAATELTWGIERGIRWDPDTFVIVDDPTQDRYVPGIVSFKRAALEQGGYRIQVYKVGQSQPFYASYNPVSSDSSDQITWIDDSIIAHINESGAYYFTVTAVGDGVNYADGPTVRSETWNYVKPARKLTTPTQLSWEWPEAVFNVVEDEDEVYGCLVEFLYAPDDSDVFEEFGGAVYFVYTDRAELEEGLLQNAGQGYYAFRVKLMSMDITVAANSEWSAISPAYYLSDFHYHSWKEATCAEPKTCTICGVTEGTTLPHNFVSDVCTCGAIRICETFFPDVNFRNYLMSQEYGRDGALTKNELSNVTEMFVLGLDIQDLTGIEYFTALTWLNCNNNQLTSLDVSSCTELVKLNCNNNHLKSLDVSGCTKLEWLSCHDNQLTRLDVSKCTALKYLYCQKNLLKSLDVSGCTALGWLHCYENQLTSMDLSNCTSMMDFYYTNNNRTVHAVDNKVDLSILAADGFDVSRTKYWQGGTIDGNILTVTANEVTYSYDLGNGNSAGFTLMIEGPCFHNWQEATCTAPKTCTRCGATEGEKTPHVFNQEKEDPKYLISAGTGSTPTVYKKSCKCGEAGEETFEVRFKDVPKNAYFYNPVMWAVENKITSGTGDGTTFEPNAVCTRGQVVTFLWRAAGQPEPKSADNPFKDVKTTDYFYKAVLWALENKITTGTGDGTTFEPHANCNRGQIVTFLSRAKNGKATTSTNPFKDVASNAYYYNPVLWAVEKGITTGTGDGTTFEPNANCTRGQVITFLYRAYTK